MMFKYKFHLLIIRAIAYLDRRGKRRARAFGELRSRFYQEYWREVAKLSGATLDAIGYGFYQIERDGKQVWIQSEQVPLDGPVNIDLALNKPLTYQIIHSQGAPVPRHLEYRLSELDAARKFLLGANRPCVVKPAFGTGAGDGVTTRVTTTRQLNKASFRAARYRPRLLVEEEISGSSFRLLYLNGELLDAVRRDPPSITGDGSSDIRTLIAEENRKRLNDVEMSALSPLEIDPDCLTTLAEQDLTLASIPPKRQVIRVKNVANQNSSAQNHCVRHHVHPSTLDLCERLVKGRFELAGIDLITPDISMPLDECGGVVSEINTTPGLHHHVLVTDRDQRLKIGVRILDHVLTHKSFAAD